MVPNPNLGSKPQRRLTDGSSAPDETGWGGCLNAICKKRGVQQFDTVATKRPHHRQLCLDICNWGREPPPDQKKDDQDSSLSKPATWHTMTAAQALFRGDSEQAVKVLKKASTRHPELLFVSLALQLIGKGDESAKSALDFDERVASKTDPYLRAISTIIATGDWTHIANQKSLPLRDRIFVAVRHFADDALTSWLEREVSRAVAAGDVGAIALTGITDTLVDVLARYVQKFGDYQTATLLLSFCAPRFVDDIRAAAFRRAYRDYLQRNRAFMLRAKFNAESTRRSVHNGRPTIRPPPRQIALRCVYCDAETSLAQSSLSSSRHHVDTTSPLSGSPAALPPSGTAAAASSTTTKNAAPNPLTENIIGGGISCRNCKRHLPRCAVCLEIVGMPRGNQPVETNGGSGAKDQSQSQTQSQGQAQVIKDEVPPARNPAGKFSTFCLRCEHVLHLDHARLWFARHRECPVPECRCKCNFRANPELSYN